MLDGAVSAVHGHDAGINLENEDAEQPTWNEFNEYRKYV